MLLLKSIRRALIATHDYQPKGFICSTNVVRSKRSRANKIRAVNLKPKSKKPVIPIWPNMTVIELAEAMESRPDYIFELMTFIDNTARYKRADSIIKDITIIKEIVSKAGCKHRPVLRPCFTVNTTKLKDAIKQPSADPKDLVLRPPVVTIMGHVDHGKTTLLDTLRHSSVVESEFGGITQHIGAFSLIMENGKKITFLDTPGHAAFSTIRERGANVTDIVVLVVAAEDGVMEQTLESIRMANNAHVPMIIAINKIDKFGSNIEAVKKDLLKQGIQVEDLGGAVQCVPISALKGTNINQLSEAILLEAELLNLTATRKGLVEAVVIESKLDPFRGKLSTAIIQRGTLKKGKILVAGTAWAKVRAMYNSEGNQIVEALPADPVEISGWREFPHAGMEILEVESEKMAHDVIRYREQKFMEEKQKLELVEIEKRQDEHNKTYKEKLTLKRSLGKTWLKPTGPKQKEFVDNDTGPKLAVVIKGDVNGSVESILNLLITYKSHDNCKLDIVSFDVGNVVENDIELAEAFDAIIYAFNVQCSTALEELAISKNVKIKNHNIIYKLVDDLKEEITARLLPKDVEEIIGEGVVLQDFEITDRKKKVHVAGSRCEKGMLKKSSRFRIVRNNDTIFDGTLKSLKHLKNDVESIKNGVECGIQLNDANFVFEKDDQIICYEVKSVNQVTDWNPGF